MSEDAMRISELARRCGVSVPTIKYYLREGLLPAGVNTAPNQAVYGEEHVRRLLLIRLLLDVGGLSVPAARDMFDGARIVEESPAEARPAAALLGLAHRSVAHRTRPRLDAEAWDASRAEVIALATRQGWRVRPDSPALTELTEAIAAARALKLDGVLSALDTYAEAATLVATREIGVIGEMLAGAPDRANGPASTTEMLVVGAVWGEVALGALHRLAQESVLSVHGL